MIGSDERIEDLQYNGLKIIQKTTGYRFTTDAVLLANFVKGAKGKKVADVGCGSGIIAILVAEKQQPKYVLGIEIQQEVAQMAERSVALNNLTDKIEIKNADVRALSIEMGEVFDVVVVNPPYRKVGSGLTQRQDTLCMSRHEVTLNLEEVFASAKRLLKFGGSMFMVHQAERMAEAFALGHKYGLEAKELCPVCARHGSNPNVFLARFVKGGKVGLKWLEPIVVFDADGNYSVTVKKLYGDSFLSTDGQKEKK